jgi:C-terminal processing protease CtpA/Prc
MLAFTLVQVVKVTGGGPAEAGGVLYGDMLAFVDGVDVQELSGADVAQLLTGVCVCVRVRVFAMQRREQN